jgi:medium-chain acyl-[acyl-carrier-protein] hydrolase
MMSDNRWIARRSGPSRAKVRLFCFPHAGGTTLAYRRWQTRWSEHDVEVCPVQLPGRENRLDEPAFRQIEPLVQALAVALAPLCDRPFAFFGHSMGTLAAFELAHQLRARGLPEPSTLLMSAHRAPSRTRSRPAIHALPGPAFASALRELGGTPEAVLTEPDLFELFTPTLRGDLEVTETYRYAPRPPLRCPITVFGGREDPRVDPDELEAWRSETQGAFDLRLFEGGHFYLKDREAEVLAAIDTRLHGLLDPQGHGLL